MSETKNSVGSSTAVEIHVQVPRQTIDKADNHEAASTLTISTLKYRSSGQRTATSQLESGRPDRDTVPPGLFRRFLPSELFCKILEGVNLILQLGSLLFWVFVVLLSAVCTNIFLFRRPLAYASQLEPILEQRRKCGDDARLSLCSRRSPLPNSVVEFGGSWQRYLGDKKKEWVWFAWLAGFLSAFVLVTLQISDKSDLATRVLAYMTFIAMLFSVMVNQYLFPCYLDSERANDIHYAYHLLECADAEISSTWNIHMLLSMSNVSTWWVVLLSGATFTSVFYHDTEMRDPSPDTALLSFWQMLLARVAMVTFVLVTALCWLFTHLRLKGLVEKAIQQEIHVLSP